VELAFLRFGKVAMQSETAQHLLDVLLVRLHILGVDEDVIKIHDDADIYDVKFAQILFTPNWIAHGV